MKLLTSLDSFTLTKQPIAATIGNFDGIHIGHQHVITQLKEVAKNLNGISVVITFSNSPSTVLSPEKPVQLICSIEQKLALLEQSGIDRVVLLPFTKEFSEQSAQQFLQKLMAHIPLSHLVLGYDTRIGKDRLGDEKAIRALAKQLRFQVDYCEAVLVDDSPVSSSRIRKSITGGNLESAEKLLGRKVSHILRTHPGQGLGKTIGFSTLNFDVEDLCLPPIGVYSVWLKTNEGIYKSVANLGYAPTVRHEKNPQLEVHVMEEDFHTPQEKMEVMFHRWIREEKKFDGIEALRKQISQDIQVAQQQLKEEF